MSSNLNSIGKEIGHYYGQYSKSAFSKIQTEIYVCKDYIEGTAIIIDSGFYASTISFHYDIKAIIDVVEVTIDRHSGIEIVSEIRREKERIYILGIKDTNTLLKQIKSARDEKLKEKLREYQRIKTIQDEKRRIDQEKRHKEQEKEQEKENFYQKCFSFHIAEHDRPAYYFLKEKMKCAAMYIDEQRNLNFLAIDGENLLENNAVIPYDKLHYYEKAGTIHFATEINGSGSSFGGSFSSGTVSKSAVIWGGVLFGAMGMAAGALLSYKPAEYIAPTFNLNISSNTHKIDDRSVILNYFSEAKNQYIDIELPADTYNFLQTHIPRKKYDIVLAIEKSLAVNDASSISLMRIETDKDRVERIAQPDSMVLLKDRIDKLKLMKESGLLSDEEFEEKRRKMIESI